MVNLSRMLKIIQTFLNLTLFSRYQFSLSVSRLTVRGTKFYRKLTGPLIVFIERGTANPLTKMLYLFIIELYTRYKKEQTY